MLEVYVDVTIECFTSLPESILSISFWLFYCRIILFFFFLASLDKPSKTTSLCRPIHSDSDILWELCVNLFRMCGLHVCCEWELCCDWVCECVCESVHNIKQRDFIPLLVILFQSFIFLSDQKKLFSSNKWVHVVDAPLQTVTFLVETK